MWKDQQCQVLRAASLIGCRPCLTGSPLARQSDARPRRTRDNPRHLRQAGRDATACGVGEGWYQPRSLPVRSVVLSLSLFSHISCQADLADVSLVELPLLFSESSQLLAASGA